MGRLSGALVASQRPCVACGDPRPDAGCGPADDVCAEARQMRHELGDHRRCERFGWACATADSHPAIRAAGIAATARTGRSLAVVCLACADDEGPRIIATMAGDLSVREGLTQRPRPPPWAWGSGPEGGRLRRQRRGRVPCSSACWTQFACLKRSQEVRVCLCGSRENPLAHAPDFTSTMNGHEHP